jgi:hypothetical protein
MNRALLMASGGAGAIPAIPEQGRWVRSVSNPVLLDTSATGNAAQEVSVFYDGPGDWKMAYRGGVTPTCAVGYATSSDGVSWTRYGSNPTLGQGGSGIAYSVVQPCVMKIGSTYYCYANKASDQSKILFTSTDLISWTGQTITITLPSGMTWWGDSYVFKEGSTWYGLFDCANFPSTYWRLHLYTSSDGQTWTIANGGSQLSSLQISSGCMYGSAFLVRGGAKIGGRYHLYYHAAPAGATSNGNLPTDCYHASSTDLINWTVVTPNPILTHLGGSSFEKEQIADVRIVEVGGQCFMYYSGVDDTGGHAGVGLAIAGATLEEIISGSA